MSGPVKKTLEQAVAEQAAILAVAGDGVIGVDHEGRSTFVSARAASMLGYAAEELIGQPLHEKVHHTRPDGRPYPAEECPLTRTLAHGTTERVDEERLWRKDGTGVPVDYVATPLRAGERITGAVLAIRDVSERLVTMERLRRVNRALQVIRECNSALVRARDEPALLADVCRLLVAHGGYRLAWVGFAEHDEARTIRPVAWAGEESGYLEGLRLTWADDDPRPGPSGRAIRTRTAVLMRHIATDPAYAPWREEALQRGYASTAALPLHDGRVALGVLRVYAPAPDAFDDDEMRLLQELANDLAYGVVALRTGREAEQRWSALIQSERLAALGRLAAGVAHELRNPLTVIDGRAQILRMQLAGDPPPTAEALAQQVAAVENAVGRMRRIVEGLSTYSKPSRPEPQRLDMVDLVRAAGDLVAYDARKRGVTVAVEAAAGIPAILGDRTQLMQVLVNLATNGIEAMSPEGRLTLRVGTRTGGTETFLPVRIEVADTGPGIPAEILGRIWEPFYTTKPEGTGLGLSIVKGIVAEHPGATLDVVTRPGEGTTFVLTLPAASPPAG